MVAAPHAFPAPRPTTHPTENDEPAIRLTDVVKRYGATAAVNGLSLAVRRGEVLGLLGPNGSGKTTTINMLCGLLAPTSGSIEVLGVDVVRHPKAIRPLLGAVPQETALYEELSAWRNLIFHAEMYRVPRAQRKSKAEQMLHLVQLADRRDSPVSSFSGGMKRRLAIARALLHEPEVLYLDEPSLGVDVLSRRAIWDHIRHLRQDRKTVLITTNYLEEASELCDRIVIIDHGRVVALDTPGNLRRRFGTCILDINLEPAPTARLCADLGGVAGVVSTHVSGRRLSVTYADEVVNPAAVLDLVMEHGRVTALNQRVTTLDEVFLRVTGNWNAA